MRRRGMGGDGRCTRCLVPLAGTAAPLDTVEHYLLHCAALDGARARFRDLFHAVERLPPHVAVRALLGGPLPPRVCAAHWPPPPAARGRRLLDTSPHLPALALFYEHLHAEGLTV
jgi:hypothetical protein